MLPTFRDLNRRHAHFVALALTKPNHRLPMNAFFATSFRTATLAVVMSTIQTSQANLSFEIGKTSGGASTTLNSTTSFTFNFGVTSQAGELSFSNLKIAASRDNGATAPLIVQIYSGLGGTGTLLSTIEIPASSVSAGNMTYQTLGFAQPLLLSQGAYSIRISTTATGANSSYNFRPDILTLGNAGVTLDTSQWVQDSNTTGTAGTTLAPAAGYVLADASVGATNVNIGRFHTGTSPSASVNVSNVAPASSGGVTESLSVAQGSVTGAASISSLPGSPLVQGAGQQVNIALNAAAGAQTGTVQLNFSSVKDGSNSTRTGNDPISVGSSTITVSGVGYTGQSVWSKDANGNWNLNDFANWDDEGGTPGMDGAASVADSATFGSAITANRTISLNGNNPHLRELVFENSEARYTLARGTGGSITLGNATHAGALENRGGSHSISADIALGNRLTVTGASGTATTIAGAISGAHGLTKQGAGTLHLEGANSYTGETLAAAGTLIINGSTSSWSELTIGEDATLGGSGTIGGITTISGIHSPGNSPGIQTFEDNLTYTVGSSILWELVGNTTSGRGDNYDGIDVGGNLAFTGTTTISLDFAIGGSLVDWGNAFWSEARLGTDGWKIFDVEGSISGFQNLALGGSLLDSNELALGSVRSGASFFLYQGNDGIYLNYAAIPEPSAALLGIFGSLLLLRRKRPA
jgi:autotransporter-associated beta strand protein